MKINKSDLNMKKYWLYVVALLLPLFALAQAPPQFTTTIGRTPCGGNITVEWRADESILRDYWAILLKNNREQARQGFDLTQKKATFTGLSNGAYTVKVQKKTGQVGYGGTSNRISITGTYNGFQVDTSQTAATEVAAGGECGASGKITIKIKNGVGPFVLKAYEVGQTTPAVTSAVTNKSGNETSVELSGLKANTTYQIEVTDQVGNAGCSRTEPKSNLSYTTKPALGSFLATDPQIEICQPSAPGITPEGSLTVRIDNANGTGPFAVQLVNKDTNEVIIASRIVTKGAGATTTARFAPESGKSIEANKTYKVIVKDNGTNCIATRELKRNYTYSPTDLHMFFAPVCNSCSEFDLIVGNHYTNSSNENLQYPFKLTLKVTRGGSTYTETFTSNSSQLIPYVLNGDYKDYGNKELRFWSYEIHKLYRVSAPVRLGDQITLTYEEGACRTGNAKTTTYVVTGALGVKPHTKAVMEPINPANPCVKQVVLKTTFQHIARYGDLVTYNTFCSPPTTARIKVGSAWQAPVAVPQTEFFRFLNATSSNYELRHDLKTTNITASSYQVEYANASGSLTGTNPNDCKHYLSPLFMNASIPSSTLSEIEIVSGGHNQLVLDTPNRGNSILIQNLDYARQLDFISDSNPLRVTLSRTAATGGNGNIPINVTGPWNLGGKTFNVRLPQTFTLKPSMVDGRKNFALADVPPGTYNVTLADNCSSITRTVTVPPAVPASYDIGDNRIKVTTSCVGGVSKGKVVFEPAYAIWTVPYIIKMIVYKDLDNGQPIHLRTGALMESKQMTEIPNPDPNRRTLKGEIGNLEPGKYLLGIHLEAYNNWITVVDNPEAQGYTYNVNDPSKRGRKNLNDTFIFKEFTIEEFNEVDPTVSIGMCDPADPNTGFVRVELPDGSEPQYPITYTL